MLLGYYISIKNSWLRWWNKVWILWIFRRFKRRTDSKNDTPKIDSEKEYLKQKRDELIDNISDNNKKGGIIF